MLVIEPMAIFIHHHTRHTNTFFNTLLYHFAITILAFETKKKLQHLGLYLQISPTLETREVTRYRKKHTSMYT